MFGWLCLGCLKVQHQEEDLALELANGALILEHLITSFNGRCNPFRVFSKQELTTATNNYHQTRILHDDLSYTLFKGLHEGREICVKKFTARSLEDEYIAWFVNEVAVASQLSKHKNVLKFLGCCLETQLPTLVFEFSSNGTLSDRVFSHLSPLSWEDRLRIATEIAQAVSYLHEGVSKAIIHRDIKTRNIFLDQHLGIKLFEFGLSLPVPLGEEHVDAQVVGSVGFIAPESQATGRFTEKSDVYSFGAVLFEIFTGHRAWNILHEEVGVGGEADESSSTATSGSRRRGSRLRVRNREGDDDEINKEVEYVLRNAMRMPDQGKNMPPMECAELTLMCLKFKPDQRPTIKQVGNMLKDMHIL